MENREIVLDTETTGLDPASGDRLVEIACVELVNSLPSGRTFHAYLNPERDVPHEAYRIHGLSTDFLRDKPKFHEICDSFLAFIEESRLIIHNAEFDLKFLNSELQTVKRAAISPQRVTDTLALARKKHPGSPNSLDALCARYRIDNSQRTKHGALLDSELLAEVYLELTGGRQKALALQQVSVMGSRADIGEILASRSGALARPADRESLRRHRAFMQTFRGETVWDKYLSSK